MIVYITKLTSPDLLSTDIISEYAATGHPQPRRTGSCAVKRPSLPASLCLPPVTVQLVHLVHM